MIAQEKRLKIDLHTHSSASDGTLNPAALVRLAESCGVTCLALTDHDCVAGLRAAEREATAVSMAFVPGIELSVNWADTCIHVVGLGIDRDNRALLCTCGNVSRLRRDRARRIDACLEREGIAGTLEAAYALAGNPENISRSHFARVLLARGVVQNEQEAFDRFLGVGRPAYVTTAWPALSDAVALIHGAGGLAVLAHPGRYRMRELWQREALVEAFARASGDALEVTSGSQASEFTQMCANWAKRFSLYASSGSDFHKPEGGRPMPGAQALLPEGLPSVLELL